MYSHCESLRVGCVCARVSPPPHSAFCAVAAAAAAAGDGLPPGQQPHATHTHTPRINETPTHLRVEHADVRVLAALAQARRGRVVDDLARVLCDQLVALKRAARPQAISGA